MFKNAKSREKVYSKEYGEGLIAQVCTKTVTYPVIIQFNGIIHISFTYDGKEWKNDSNKSLFYTIKKEEAVPQVVPDLVAKKYMVFVENCKSWNLIYKNYDDAVKAAIQLSEENIDLQVDVITFDIVETFKAKIVVETLTNKG